MERLKALEEGRLVAPGTELVSETENPDEFGFSQVIRVYSFGDQTPDAIEEFFRNELKHKRNWKELEEDQGGEWHLSGTAIRVIFTGHPEVFTVHVEER